MCTSLPLQMQVARHEGVEEGDKPEYRISLG